MIAGLGPAFISATGFCFAPEKSMTGVTKGFGSVDIAFFSVAAPLSVPLPAAGLAAGAAAYYAHHGAFALADVVEQRTVSRACELA